MAPDPTVDEWLVRIPASGHLAVEGTLGVPAAPCGVVLFVGANGSPRLRPRSVYVSKYFQCAGLATLVVDLVTCDEEAEDPFGGHLHFHLRLLIERGLCAVEWLSQHPLTRELPLGLLGTGNGAAAALLAAGRLPDRIAAVVSQGGHPELAAPWLHRVRCPTLLIAGGADEDHLAAAREVVGLMQCEKRLEVVPFASNDFEDFAALETAAALARGWFTSQLSAAGRVNERGL